MPAADAARALRLDRHLDALLHDLAPQDGAIDADMATTLRYLHELSARPIPASTFARRLRDDVIGTEPPISDRVIPFHVIPNRVILRNEGSQPRVINVSHEPSVFASAQNDTLFAHDAFPPSLNGHAPRLEYAPRSLFRPWWQRLHIAAALLVVMVMASYFVIAKMGRTVPPSRLSAITAQTEGTVPVQLRIDTIDVFVPIERRLSAAESRTLAENLWATGWLNGSPVPMAEPGEPFAAAWLDESAAPGEGGNVVLHGHLDYWDTEPALFADLGELATGDQIDITGANGAVFSYEVEWSRRFPSKVDEDQQRAILGPTAEESLTLITGAGTYESETNRFPEALVVRARFVGVTTPAQNAVEPERLKIGSIGLDAPIGRRESIAERGLVAVGDSLIDAEVLDKDWIMVPLLGDRSVVVWRHETAALGAGSNVVLEGPLEYPGAEPAVFWSLEDVKPGDRIDVYGSNRTVVNYEVDWIKRFPLAADREQRQEILGPTSTESLTLITNAGELDRATGMRSDVLAVRARFVSRWTAPVMVIPDPAECQVKPRTVAKLDATAAKSLLEPLPRPGPTPLEALAGEAADAATMDAVIAAERELVACLNANDTLRVYGLYTDHGLARLMEYVGGPMDAIHEWVPDFSGLTVPATPLPDAYHLALLSVEDVRILPDGRVAATATIESGGPGMLGIPTGIPVVHIFTPGERYLIDEFYAPMLMGDE